MSLTINTKLGSIVLKLRADAAPVTAGYISKLVKHGLYNGSTFCARLLSQLHTSPVQPLATVVDSIFS